MVLRRDFDADVDEVALNMSGMNMYSESEKDFEIEVEDGKLPGGGVKAMKLKGYKAEGSKTVAEWQSFLKLKTLSQVFVLKKKKEEGEWDLKHEALNQEKERLAHLLKSAQKDVEVAKTELSELLSQSAPCVGGSMLLVDLAGADYDHRSGGQQKESAAINKSLLALKECLRSLANTNSSVKPKFRDSKLTRVLEDSLYPRSTTSRRNNESTTVMLVNVSPASHLKKMTLNSLRYGQVFSVGTRK